MNKPRLIADLRPLSCGLTAYPHEQAYFEYYQIDLENRIPDIQHSFGYINCTDYRIACHLYTRSEARGSVLLLHGYYDHVGLFEHIIQFFLKKVITFWPTIFPVTGFPVGNLPPSKTLHTIVWCWKML